MTFTLAVTVTYMDAQSPLTEGWHDDGNGLQRWHDGHNWTPNIRPKPTNETIQTPPPINLPNQTTPTPQTTNTHKRQHPPTTTQPPPLKTHQTTPTTPPKQPTLNPSASTQHQNTKPSDTFSETTNFLNEFTKPSSTPVSPFKTDTVTPDFKTTPPVPVIDEFYENPIKNKNNNDTGSFPLGKNIDNSPFTFATPSSVPQTSYVSPSVKEESDSVENIDHIDEKKWATRRGLHNVDEDQLLLEKAGPPPPDLVTGNVNAGWYPDPVHSGRTRWYDGNDWTFHTQKLGSSQDGTTLTGVPKRPPGRIPSWAATQLDALASGGGYRRKSLTRTGSVSATFFLLVTLLGLTASIVFGWQLWGTNWVNGHEQASLAHELTEATGDSRFVDQEPVVPVEGVPEVPEEVATDTLDEDIDGQALQDGLGPDVLDAPGGFSTLFGGSAETNVTDEKPTSTSRDGTDSTTTSKPKVVPKDITPWPPANWVAPEGRKVSKLPSKAGAAFGRIRIPSIGVNKVMVVGTSDKSLSKGPGVWKAGPTPGSPGNATVAGHRTTHGAPFRDLHKLKYGDKIYVDVPGQPSVVYEVRGRGVVKPSNVAITSATKGVRLTLVACHPLNSTAYRLVVQAEMVSGPWLDKTVNRSKWRLLRP